MGINSGILAGMENNLNNNGNDSNQFVWSILVSGKNIPTASLMTGFDVMSELANCK